MLGIAVPILLLVSLVAVVFFAKLFRSRRPDKAQNKVDPCGSSSEHSTVITISQPFFRAKYSIFAEPEPDMELERIRGFPFDDAAGVKNVLYDMPTEDELSLLPRIKRSQIVLSKLIGE